MARYRGSSTKISRKFGEPIFGSDKWFERRKYPPGQHGFKKKRAKMSEYGTQLKEKQKAKYTYGILERQFANIFKKALRKEGKTGELLMQLCEARLDNVVYRMGLAPTRRAARQLVNHGHILVNNSKLDIPSHALKENDIVGLKEKSKNLEAIKKSILNKEEDKFPSWLSWDPIKKEGVFLSFPKREDIPENINEQLIVELYSK